MDKVVVETFGFEIYVVFLDHVLVVASGGGGGLTS
jgi:hypothetical protein